MAIEYHISRDFGHPWDGDKRPGFDLLEIKASTSEDLNSFVKKAEAKFWHPWIVGVDSKTGVPCAAMYKPSGIREEWADSPSSPWTPACTLYSKAIGRANAPSRVKRMSP